MLIFQADIENVRPFSFNSILDISYNFCTILMIVIYAVLYFISSGLHQLCKEPEWWCSIAKDLDPTSVIQAKPLLLMKTPLCTSPFLDRPLSLPQLLLSNATLHNARCSYWPPLSSALLESTGTTWYVWVAFILSFIWSSSFFSPSMFSLLTPNFFPF